MITIKEMAEMLGISTTTVSNVIHGKTDQVSKSTVLKVQRMLEEYDYVPNISARNLASNSSRIVGVAMVNQREKHENYLKDAFLGELVGSIERALRHSGYFMMMYMSDNTEELLKSASSWNVDGLIMLGMTNEAGIAIGRRFKKPKVFIDSYLDESLIDGVNIGLEDKKGGYLMTKYLISKGHKKIAFLADNFTGVDSVRYEGFHMAMEEAKLPCSRENFIFFQSDVSILEESLSDVFKLSKNYTAFFCASDYFAVLVMNYMLDHGIRVPEDFSIAGFDDNYYSRFARPAITTVHQNISEKGALAVDYLFRLMEKKPIDKNSIALSVELCIRNSVGNPNEVRELGCEMNLGNCAESGKA